MIDGHTATTTARYSDMRHIFGRALDASRDAPLQIAADGDDAPKCRPPPHYRRADSTPGQRE